MGVLAASIIKKSGKVLVARQYVDMSRIRIEGLLAAFPKLIGVGKQHTFVETDRVRYVYQPIDLVYLVVLTNKQSNILEDLETLSILSKLVPEYAPSVDEEEILYNGLDLIFAFDEVISLGRRENLTISQVRQYCEMESQEEISQVSKPKASSSAAASVPSKGLAMQLGKNQRTHKFLQSLKAEGEEIVEEVRPSSIKSIVAASPAANPVMLNLEEKLNVTLKRDGGLANLDVQGTLSLQILNEEDAYIHVQVESKDDPRILFKTHPNINKELFSRENILGLKDPDRPFPIDQLGAGVGLLKWRMQSMDESVVPLTISCWPSVSGNKTDVSIEYEASSMFDLKNVIISVPFPSLREAPNVRQIDGEWRYEQRNSTFEWSILLIDDSNRRGSVEFAVPATDPSAFFPILVRFTATDTFSGLKVANVIPLKGGSPPKYAQRTQLCTENYRVV